MFPPVGTPGKWVPAKFVPTFVSENVLVNEWLIDAGVTPDPAFISNEVEQPSGYVFCVQTPPTVTRTVLVPVTVIVSDGCACRARPSICSCLASNQKGVGCRREMLSEP